MLVPIVTVRVSSFDVFFRDFGSQKNDSSAVVGDFVAVVHTDAD